MPTLPKPGYLRAVLSIIAALLWTIGVVGGFLQWFSHAITIRNLTAPEDTQEKAFLQNAIPTLHAMPYLPWLLIGGAAAVIVYLCVQLADSSAKARMNSDPMVPATAREQGQNAVKLVDDTVGLAQRLAQELNLYIAGLPFIEEPEELAFCQASFVNERWTEAKDWLALPDERLRYSVWLAKKPGMRLEFAHGDADVVKGKDFFEYGEGLAGKVFASGSQEPLNVIDPAKVDGWKRLTKRSTFRAIVLNLVPYGTGRALGVLCVTRRRREKFDPIAVRAIQLLGYTIGAAIGATNERRNFLRAGQLPQSTQ